MKQVESGKKLIIIGGGYAGFWSAMSAIRQSRALGKSEQLSITLINLDPYLTMRPRLYETSLEGIRVELEQYLKPLGIEFLVGKVEHISPVNNTVSVATTGGKVDLSYDYLILGSGSNLKEVSLPGIEKSFNIDDYTNAKKLDNHMNSLAKRDFSEKGDTTFVIVGGGFTGIEASIFIQEKANLLLKKGAKSPANFEVYILEKENTIAQGYVDAAKEYIMNTLKDNQINIVTGTSVTQINDDFIVLSNGQKITTHTVIWTVGMIANKLTNFFEGKRDVMQRLYVDSFLKLENYENVIFAGDVANVTIDSKGNESLMACQFSMDQGKVAGHNAVNDMFGKALSAYEYPNYVTCLDLGSNNAILTAGMERNINKTGLEAKAVKKNINEKSIYPLETAEDNVRGSVPRCFRN